MLLERSITFNPDAPAEALHSIPRAPGVFALFARSSEASGQPANQPYISKSANLHGRLARLLSVRGVGEAAEQPGAAASRRVRLAQNVGHIEFTATGSEFESLLALYHALFTAHGVQARRRLHLKPPAFLRMSVENPYPRLYVTTRVAKSAAAALFGPFASRAAAERYADAVLNLFELRRCTDDLHPDPGFPGCPYSEMKMCLAPCFRGCTDERYREEVDRVLSFLSTRGKATIEKLERERDSASEALDFEKAAALHHRIDKATSAAGQASEAVHSLAALNGIVVQPAAPGASEAGEAALFRMYRGIFSGPVLYSTTGIRLANESSGSSSLFAQPFAVEPIPLALEDATAGPPAASTPATNLPERRLDEALSRLEAQRRSMTAAASSQALADHLSIFTRWFYRPASRRVGEVVFASADGQIPHKALLRAISRVVASSIGASSP